MTQQTINIGSAANDGTGDPVRTAFNKINLNFGEVYGSPAMENLFFVNTAADPHNADVGLQAATFRVYGYDGSEQFRIETVGSATSYLKARGGGASSMPVLVSAGAAADIPFSIAAQGLGGIFFGNGAGTHVVIDDVGNPTANYFTISGNSNGNPPQIASTGTDTNVDIKFVPQGSGVLRFGTYTAGAINVTADMTTMGSIATKDVSGTARKLAAQ